MQENCALVVKSYSTLPGRSSSPTALPSAGVTCGPDRSGSLHLTGGFRGTQRKRPSQSKPTLLKQRRINYQQLVNEIESSSRSN